MSEKEKQPEAPLTGTDNPERKRALEQAMAQAPPPDPNPQELQPGDSLPAGAPASLKEAVAAELSGEDAERAEKESGALEFMLGAPTAQPFWVDAMVDTPEGPRKLRFHMRQLDAKTIEKIEDEHTEGIGPWAKVDRLAINAKKVAKATQCMEDTKGKRLEPTDEEFIRDAIDPAIAFERMFTYQPGVGDRLAEEIDRMAGAMRDRVGIAEREMTTAVKNS